MKADNPPPLKISLAEWSLHRMIESGKLATLDFPQVAREEFGIEAVELVNILMEGPEVGQIRELRRRAEDHGVKVLLIMCDDEGDLSAAGRKERLTAARNHFKWVDAAAGLGCRAIRVNTGGETAPPTREMAGWCAESCRELLQYAEKSRIQVLIENHWGLSGDLDLLVALMEEVNHPLFGTLPDFGNFPPGADRYQAVAKMMPYAKAVSAKCHDFDDRTGEETATDFGRMLKIVRDAGYQGTIGIEYEGERLDEFEGVRRAKRLLEKLIAPKK